MQENEKTVIKDQKVQRKRGRPAKVRPLSSQINATQINGSESRTLTSEPTSKRLKLEKNRKNDGKDDVKSEINCNALHFLNYGC